MLVISNCHDGKALAASRKMKNGEREENLYPDTRKFYNELIGGVNLSDQLTDCLTVYYFDRKPVK